jgi:Carboxypeptidase regulatory-like domain
MKTIKILALLVFASLLTLTACKKEPGFEGKNNIKGTVSLNGAPVANAIVHIAFDTKEATTEYNASTVTAADGTYSFSALSKGDYFVNAEYSMVTNLMEITLMSLGAAVTIGSKKDDVTVDLTLE